MSLRPIEIEMIRAEARGEKKPTKLQQFKHTWETGPEGRMLQCKKANDWMKQEYGKPATRSLFGGFWQEHELCILFADTNLGKSLLAVQIADCITRNVSIGPFANQADDGTTVLYLDCEQSAKQFEARYTDSRYGSYLFADMFYRGEFHPMMYSPARDGNYDHYMQTEIEHALKETHARVLIIDNLTYMRRGQQAGDALALMKTLKALKTKYCISILILAHTPKRNAYMPLSINDLQGSKMLINFCDSAFAIGQSQTQPHLRYLKQIKQRNNQEQYGVNNVCLITRHKDLNFLGYQFEGYARETDHLRRLEKGATEQEKQQVLELHKKDLSLRQIATRVGIHFTTVGRIIRQDALDNINQSIEATGF